jgi:hypothetical protein
MSISPITGAAQPNTVPQVDTQTALQVQARAPFTVPPTAITTTTKQESSSGFAKPDSQRRPLPGGRGRIVDISA